MTLLVIDGPVKSSIVIIIKYTKCYSFFVKYRTYDLIELIKRKYFLQLYGNVRNDWNSIKYLPLKIMGEKK